MKIELHIDTNELTKEIAKEVVKTLKLHLKGKTEEDTIFTVKTLAEYLQVSVQWVYERIHLKEIQYIKMGKFPRFRKSEINKWLDSFKIPVINHLSRPLRVIK